MPCPPQISDPNKRRALEDALPNSNIFPLGHTPLWPARQRRHTPSRTPRATCLKSMPLFAVDSSFGPFLLRNRVFIVYENNLRRKSRYIIFHDQGRADDNN